MTHAIIATALVCAVGACFAAAPPAITAESLAAAERLYADVYGKDAEAATKSKAAADRTRFARKLADAIPGVKDNPSLVRVLRQKAVEFIGAPADTAAVALAVELRRAQAADPDLRSAVLPELAVLLDKAVRQESKAPARQKLADELLGIYRGQTTARVEADDVAGALAVVAKAKSIARTYLPATESREAVREWEAIEKDVRHRQQLLDAASREEAVLKKSPQDPKANQTLGLIKLQLGHPAAAASHLALAEAEPLRKLGAALGKEPAASGLELGDAYRAAAEALEKAEKAGLLAKAREHYEAFLDSDPKHAEATRVKLILPQLPLAAAPSGGVVAPIAGTYVVLLDEDRDVVAEYARSNAAGGTLTIEEKDRFSGRIGFRASGKSLAVMKNWNYDIVEVPEKNQFRYLEFAVRSVGDKDMVIAFHFEPGGWFGYELGAFGGADSFPRIKLDPAPAQWRTFRRDLYKDIGATGPVKLRGMYLYSNGKILFDFVCLGRSPEDLDRLVARARARGN
jgi:tetratricopeptide (TPR) repeat protein